MKNFLKSIGPQSIIIIIVIIVIFGISFQSIDKVSKTNQEDRSEAIEQVILKASLQCYALEGSYPSTIEYLKENYGIILDEDQYYYFYDIKGANIAPNIRVIKR